eukprot:scaffold34351_cov54-Phaeocystis_antarctica.AAC.1
MRTNFMYTATKTALKSRRVSLARFCRPGMLRLLLRHLRRPTSPSPRMRPKLSFAPPSLGWDQMDVWPARQKGKIQLLMSSSRPEWVQRDACPSKKRSTGQPPLPKCRPSLCDTGRARR